MAKVLQLCCSCVLVGSALGLKVKWTPANGKKPMPFSKKYREANALRGQALRRSVLATFAPSLQNWVSLFSF